MIKKDNELWVFIECFKSGKPKNIGLEILNEAKKISKNRNFIVVAIIFGYKISESIKIATASKADKIIYIDNIKLKDYSTSIYTHNFFNLINKYNPHSILIGASANGRDMAPRLSCRLNTGLTADCINFEIEKESNKILWTRPTFGGNLMATIVCDRHTPQMGTIRAGVFKKAKLDSSLTCEVISEEFSDCENKIEIIKEILDSENETINLEEAKIIVSAGLGVKNEKGLSLVRQLANELGATLGASRAVVDTNLISRLHQVGQTGKNVSPKIYIACGISGAIQHMVGMKTSDIIIAINNDEEAPIFEYADYKIVGDIFEIIPLLIEEIKSHKK